MELKALIGQVATGAQLTRDEAAAAFESMMSGEATPSQMGGLLMALRVRGETIDEITGAVSAMRAKMVRVDAPPGAIDVVGTGGDASGSYNISTCAAFVVAGAGVPVAKHGNRALSSRSGAADVLTALGVKIDLTPEDHRPLHCRSRHRLHVRPGASSGDEERGRNPGGARHADDLQPAGPAVEPCQREAADGRGLLQAVGRAPRPRPEKSRLGARLCGARVRRARRNHHVRADLRRGARQRRRAYVRDRTRRAWPDARETGKPARWRCRDQRRCA